MKTKNHGITWAISRFILALLIAALLVYGLAFYYVPMFEYMRNTERQAAAVIICAFLLCGYGLVWAWAKISGKL